MTNLQEHYGHSFTY